MLLLIDAGNTRIKWAVADAIEHGRMHSTDQLGTWHASGVVDSVDTDKLSQVWQGMNIRRVMLSNVAGEALHDRLQMALSNMTASPPIALELFTSVPSLCGIQNAYRDPAQLGCDRFASAIGARALFGDIPLLIATCGTATTIDAITADGVFIGGMILPGVALMASALARHTAQLPFVAAMTDAPQPFADNTDDAIANGCIEAQVGAIERAFAAHTKQHGVAHCVLSGGAADLIASRLSIPYVKVENLVLIGLRVAAVIR